MRKGRGLLTRKRRDIMKKFIMGAVCVAACAVLACSAIGFAACTTSGGTDDVYKVYAPDGAPALGLAYLMSQDTADAEDDAETASAVASAAVSYAPAEYGIATVATEPSAESLDGTQDGTQDGTEEGTSLDAVRLKAIEATQIGTDTDCDYYLAPEPAASTKVNAMSGAGLAFAGDLQELYSGASGTDGETGYPQAVIVVKKDLVSKSVIGDFLDAVAYGAEWLLDESTSAETIVNAVTSHLPADTTPTFTAANLSKTVIEHSAVYYTAAKDCKTAINTYMEQVNAVADSSFGTAEEAFFATSLTASAEDGASVDAASLAGKFEYNIVDSSAIQTYVTGNDPAADICILPVNLAVKLLGSGETYQLAGTITHGNLFLLATDGSTITADNISSLAGKTIGCIQLANVPGLTLKLTLKNYGLDYTVLE